MLHSILVAMAVLASPTQCCGGGGFGFLCCRPAQPAVVAPPLTIAPPKVDILKLIRIDEYPLAVRIGLAIIAPRPFGSAMTPTLQADAQPQR